MSGSKKFVPTGAYVAMLTPMNADESLRLDAIPGQVERFIAAGIDGLFCLGTNGEFYALGHEEKVAVMEAVIAAARGRLPVCVGAGCVTTRETVSLAREAERRGATFISVITPYYAAISQAELERHYRTVAAAVTLPVMMYNIPPRTGTTIAPETVARLAKVANIIGIKDSQGTMPSLRAFIDAVPPGFAVFCGSDALILEGLRAGAMGGISGLANIVPALVSGITAAWKRGDTGAAEAAQAALSELRAIYGMGNPNSVVKSAVALLGWPVGPAREPVAGVAAEHEKALREALNASAAAQAARAP